MIILSYLSVIITTWISDIFNFNINKNNSIWVKSLTTTNMKYKNEINQLRFSISLFLSSLTFDELDCFQHAFALINKNKNLKESHDFKLI